MGEQVRVCACLRVCVALGSTRTPKIALCALCLAGHAEGDADSWSDSDSEEDFGADEAGASTHCRASQNGSAAAGQKAHGGKEESIQRHSVRMGAGWEDVGACTDRKGVARMVKDVCAGRQEGLLRGRWGVCARVCVFVTC